MRLLTLLALALPLAAQPSPTLLSLAQITLVQPPGGMACVVIGTPAPGGPLVCAALIGASIAKSTSGSGWTFNATPPPAVNFAYYETPNGAIDGSNSHYSLVHTPNPPASLILIRNGLVLSPIKDYTLTGNVIAFALGSVPQPGDSLTAASYQY